MCPCIDDHKCIKVTRYGIINTIHFKFDLRYDYRYFVRFTTILLYRKMCDCILNTENIIILIVIYYITKLFFKKGCLAYIGDGCSTVIARKLGR